MNAQSTAYLFTFLGMMLNASALGVSWHLARPMPGGGAWFAGASLVFLGFLPLIINLSMPWLPLVSMHNLAVAVGQVIVVGGIFLIRPCEVSSCILDVAILEVGHDALGGFSQRGHEVVGSLT